jgi:hypothetical protein
MGYVSAEAAKAQYGVALDKSGGVDEIATGALRKGAAS